MTVDRRLLPIVPLWKRSVGLSFAASIAPMCLLGLLLSSAFAGTGVPYSRQPEGINYPGGAGKVTASTSQVGSTELFWAFAQGFFSGYYRISASCQDISDHAYLFAEDAYLNDLSASSTDPDILFAAGIGGVWKSTDGGLTWNLTVIGLPDADASESVDSSTYNHRADMLSLFSRAEYGETFDTVWVGTQYGSFWSTNAGQTFSNRYQGMAKKLVDTTYVNERPNTYDLLGHPTETRYLWAATIDGVYMTRNANKWKRLSGGLPASEGTSWQSIASYAVAYDNDLLYVSTDKGIFYGDYRPLDPGDLGNSEILASWKPLGGEVTFDSVLFAHPDTLKLTVDGTTSQGLTLTAGQNVTVVDTVQGIYWAALVDESPAGLYLLLTDAKIFYYPTGNLPPSVDYSQLDLGNCIAYGYSQISGRGLLTEKQGDQTTVWLGSTAGLVSYQFSGDISQWYHANQEAISSSHETYTIYKIARKDSDYYIATDQGLFRAADPHGTWTRLTGYIGNSDRTDSAVVETRTLGFGPDQNVFTGGHFGGFQKSSDGVNFASSNLGLMHRNGTLQQLSLFANQFDNSTPADPAKGVFRTVQDWWGNLPAPGSAQDLDNDSLVTVLFLDIDDQYYLDTGDGTYISGYFDGVNEYSLLYFTNSNQREMFYLDTDPQWIHEAAAPACNQMFNLINWNQDFEEEVWLREGMASFSQYVAGYPLATGNISFPMTNNLTAWGDKDRDKEHLYSFLLLLYLYEQIFPDSAGIHQIAEVATSTYRDIPGLGRLIYEQIVGPTTNDLDYSSTFAEVFTDFMLAGALDVTDTTLAGGKYGFVGVNTVTSPTNFINWYFDDPSTPPLAYLQSFWSGQIAQVVDTLFFNNDHPISTLLVNGADGNKINYNLLYSFTGKFLPGMSANQVAVVAIPVDSLTQKGRIDLPVNLQLGNGNAAPNIVQLLTVCTSAAGEANTNFVMSDDITPPPFLDLTVAQNPVDSRYLDIYSFTSERILPDGGQLYKVENIGLAALEGPEVDIAGGTAAATGNDTLITLDQNVFFSNLPASDFVYHIAYHLENLNFPANLSFTAYGEDAAGNVKESAPVTVTADFIQSDVGGLLVDAASAASLSIPPGALTEDALVILSLSQIANANTPEQLSRTVAAPLDESHYPVGPLVSAGGSGQELTTPVQIHIPYDPALAGNSEVGVYRAEDGGWIYVGGVADPGSGLLNTNSWKFGQFQAFAGPLGDIQPEMPYAFRLGQNFPNPFNPSTRIQFELSRAQRVSAEIFNVQGQRVASLLEGVLEAGRHELEWAPNSSSSGVYFLRLQAEEGTMCRKMMFLK